MTCRPILSLSLALLPYLFSTIFCSQLTNSYIQWSLIKLPPPPPQQHPLIKIRSHPASHTVSLLFETFYWERMEFLIGGSSSSWLNGWVRLREKEASKLVVAQVVAGFFRECNLAFPHFRRRTTVTLNPHTRLERKKCRKTGCSKWLGFVVLSGTWPVCGSTMTLVLHFPPFRHFSLFSSLRLTLRSGMTPIPQLLMATKGIFCEVFMPYRPSKHCLSTSLNFGKCKHQYCRCFTLISVFRFQTDKKDIAAADCFFLSFKKSAASLVSFREMKHSSGLNYTFRFHFLCFVVVLTSFFVPRYGWEKR